MHDMESVERKLDLLEQAISEAGARVGELREENRLLKEQVDLLEHQVAEKSRRLAMLEQAEEKFISVQRQAALLRDERQTLKKQVEQLLRKVASLRAAILQWE
jgi:chromosome segregation ATPase